MRYLVTIDWENVTHRTGYSIDPRDLAEHIRDRYDFEVMVEEYVGPPAFPEGPLPERPYQRCEE